MADNVAITAGTGTSVATDDVGGVHYQKVKLALGAADAAALASSGSGAVDPGTLRVVLASDSPGVSSASGLTTGQNALSTTNEVVIAANSSRTFAEIKNVDAAITVYIGDDNTVTAANGHALRPGESFAFEGYTGAVWAIAASGTPNVTYVEW